MKTIKAILWFEFALTKGEVEIEVKVPNIATKEDIELGVFRIREEKE